LLLIKHREHTTGRAYWVIPGGGQEAGETEEACVQREMWEETGLRVQVERLLLVENVPPGDGYRCFKTYLCRAPEGEARPGYEPEEAASAQYGIVAVAWFDLDAPETWDVLVRSDPFTYPLLQKLQAQLGYAVAR
jgi:8-oxo-dGTP pyrophosphatase MutT (NUDIX family)